MARQAGEEMGVTAAFSIPTDHPAYLAPGVKMELTATTARMVSRARTATLDARMTVHGVQFPKTDSNSSFLEHPSQKEFNDAVS